MINVASALVAFCAACLTEKMVVVATLLAGVGRAPPPTPPQVVMPVPAAPVPSPAPPATRPEPPPARTSFPATWHFAAPHTLARGIIQVQPDERVVDREIVGSMLEQVAGAPGRLRAEPDHEGGKVVGMSIHGIAPGSTLARLGLVNGDSLETINGWEMGSPEEALEAFGRLGSSDELVVGIRRDGRATFFRYHVR